MWTYIGVIVGFKVVTIVFILWYTHAFATVALLVAMHVPWLIGAAILLGAPSAVWYRLIRARTRRTELLRQEFCQETPATPLVPGRLWNHWGK